MTPVETLREAARLMRDRAEAATPGPWVPGDKCVWGDKPGWTIVSDGYDGDGGCESPDDAAHIASWHPAVALAVADWLDAEADSIERFNIAELQSAVDIAALAVARAYLGGES